MPSKLQLPTPANKPIAKRTTGRTKPVAKFRMRIMVGDVIAVGPGKIALLEAIVETGSITAAAKALEMSYRRAWMLLDELNRALKKPAVDSAKGGQHGGGSEITDVGRQVIALYRHIEATAAAACKADMTRLVSLLAH